MKKSLLLSLSVGLLVAVLNGCVAMGADTVAVQKRDLIVTDWIKKDAEYKLVFFGYAGCYHFCDPRLRQIDPIFNELKRSLDVKMLFIDISTDSTQKAAAAFAKDVNKAFEAINPDAQSIKQLQKQFQDVYIRRMPDGEYLHSGFLYLLKRSGDAYHLLKIYPEFENTESVVTDIKKLSAK